MKKWLSVIFLAVLLFSVAACGSSNSSKETSTRLKDVSIMLDWYPNALHTFLYVAKEKGYFAEEGVNLEIQFPANPTDPLNLAAAGKVTLGLYYQPDVIIARANENIPVKSVASIVRAPLNHIVFMENSRIKSPKDLEGKTVGYPGIALNESLLKTMVENDGGDPSQVELVDVGFDLGASIAAEKVDAVIGAFINHEVPVLKQKGYETRNFNPVEYGVPAYSEVVLVTSDETLENHKQEIEAFWRAAVKGYEFTKANPEEALQILLTNQDEANFPLVAEVEKESLSILMSMMESDQEPFGSQTTQSWEEVTDWLKESGLVKSDPNIEEMFTTLTK
ncbi:ABC-type nitrate/sulfonate/bicarbonate transport system, periplasmic component [Schinkia azotoformans MEV2011]|uniref:ABC-type nitrate/sulfonate/bicarbonate transport system, periplasmic component n=1 Tax=Schinkia azotoformans MEV2011 TaxID=1348973 RepID=A0A072NN51_SCHAZ|nr:ABC transporter substrate-binding protein [Schinkia azotoformans]KEF39089.1 ABC-type nitrate/sulfonate/bicarbonate transport system, periplasmic component [Schinkia azotoformans MEV2011]MEC1696491.1 ABC transporter substrate-binding protein [Schinkia azotoformans]MEC1726331.1 ABC transporter substrate-binding protein [Schinkia azotoformans]MEC1781181.1 ABC transporter substrate-binding protein [Schinkia azotoformans]MED4331232.1 ABC transporter substrate-binding protein [Schinkia azotoforma